MVKVLVVVVGFNQKQINGVTDPVERAIQALKAVQQYQKDWQKLGSIGRVNKYFNVTPTFIEEFNKGEVISEGI